MSHFRPAPLKPPVSMDALDAVDIRVGTISAVEDLPETDRLVRLLVDFGWEQRTVIAGLKQERNDPVEITGRQALFVVNLPQRRIHGYVSEAMLFDIGYADGIAPVLAVPEAPVPPGVRAG